MKNGRIMRRVGVVLAALALLGGTAACTSQTQPNHVGLYYFIGSEEGNHFDHCTKPSLTDDFTINDAIFYVPIDGRTWINDDVEGADDKDLILVTAKPEPGQTTGAAVKISSQTSFLLNTFCGADNRDKNSPLVVWWEKYGRGYGADVDPGQTPEEQRKDPGWVAMLRAVLVPALKTAIKDSAKNYPASALVSGAANSPMIVDKVERKGLRVEIGELLASELKRLTGGEFFCGPSYNRQSAECPKVEVTTQAEYASADLLEAQAEKQAAVERAAAALAEASGKVDAANKLKDLLSKEQWLEYQQTVIVPLEKAKIEADAQVKMAEKCAASPSCKLILGADGTIVGTE